MRAMRQHGGGRPLAIAHRAGNEPPLLAIAEEIGPDLIETDVWLYRGRVEVRHKKTLGPYLFWERHPVDSGWPSAVSFLRDRWRLMPGWRARHRLTLDDILPLARPTTRFMLDLKGTDVRLADAVVDLVHRHRPIAPGTPPILVCSPFWEVLEAAGRRPDVRIIHSVGRDAALSRVFDRVAGVPNPAVSIHVRYLSKDLPHLARFRDAGIAVMTWPVDDGALAEDLIGRGVDGLIVDDPALLRRIAARGW